MILDTALVYLKAWNLIMSKTVNAYLRLMHTLAPLFPTSPARPLGPSGPDSPCQVTTKLNNQSMHLVYESTTQQHYLPS